MASSRIGVCVHGVALNTWCERCPSGKRYQITVSGTTASSTQATPEPPQAAEPRALVWAFALAMERKLAANDATKGAWRVDSAGMARIERCGELLQALEGEIREMRAALADVLMRVASPESLLDEAADCANYLAMICDVCGALPPTDERGR